MELMAFAIMVEPDRYRFSQMVMEAVRGLGGSLFVTAERLLPFMDLLRQERDEGMRARLHLEGSRLYGLWGRHRLLLAELPVEPEESRVAAMGALLREMSESADPELLKQRNQKIKQDLERFMQLSARQMAEVEEALERKKGELQESIHLAETDSLTGLLNRGACDRRLAEAVARCQRQGEPLALLLLDLDKFKEINDTHGHQYGDEYLKKMAASMEAAVRREVDHVCRFGGDEFTIIAFADLPVAVGIAERVLHLMEGGVSIGIAAMRPNESLEALLRRADVALYAAKEQGRGRLRVAEGDGEGA